MTKKEIEKIIDKLSRGSMTPDFRHFSHAEANLFGMGDDDNTTGDTTGDDTTDFMIRANHQDTRHDDDSNADANERYADAAADAIERAAVSNDDDDDAEDLTGWYGRLSASGHMDCTDWSGPFKSRLDAKRNIAEMYGDDIADDDDDDDDDDDAQ